MALPNDELVPPSLRFFRHDAARIPPTVQLLSTVCVVRRRRDSAGGLDGFWVRERESERTSKLLPASVRDFCGGGRRCTIHEWRPTPPCFLNSSLQVVPTLRRLSLLVVVDAAEATWRLAWTASRSVRRRPEILYVCEKPGNTSFLTQCYIVMGIWMDTSIIRRGVYK